MPVPVLNNVTLAVTYTDGQTVVFGLPRSGFAMNIANGAVYYQLLIPGSTNQDGDYSPEPQEHYLLPSMTNFSGPGNEGFPFARAYAGVRVRSANAADPATVSVI